MKRMLCMLVALAMVLSLVPMASAAEVAVTKVGADFEDNTTGDAVFTPNGGSIAYETVTGYDGQESVAAVITAPKGDTAATPQMNFQDFNYGNTVFVEFDFKATSYISGSFFTLPVKRSNGNRETPNIIRGDGAGKLEFYNTSNVKFADWAYSLNTWYRVKIWVENPPANSTVGTNRTWYFVDISYYDADAEKTEHVINTSDRLPTSASTAGNIACWNNDGYIVNANIKLDSTSAEGNIYLDNFNVKLNYTQANVTRLDVNDDETITISFDKNMKEESFNSSTVALYEKGEQNEAVEFIGVLTDNEYVITPQAGFKGETTYILELKEGIQCFEEVGLAGIADANGVLYTKTFTTPKDNRPSEGDVIEKGSQLKLGYAAENAAAVTFTVNGTEIESTKAPKRNAFTAIVDTNTLPLGVIEVVTEATDAEGNQTAYDKKYVNVVKSSEEGTVQESTGWIQKTDVNSSSSVRVTSPIGTDTTNNGWHIFNTSTYTIGEAGHIYPYVFHQNYDKGISGTIVMDIEMMADTTTDAVNLSMIGNASDYDLSSNTESVDVFNGIFNSNGCFYKSDVKYEAGKWYAIKLVLDINAGTKAMYVDGEAVYQDNFAKSYMCLGYPAIRLIQTELEGRTAYAGLSVDNWGIYAKGSVRENGAAYDDEKVGNSRIISETADTLTVKLNTPVANADNAKLFVNGTEVAGASFEAAEAITVDSNEYYGALTVNVADKIKKGDIVEVKLASGANYVTALNVDGTVKTAIAAATTTADVVFPFVVGDSNLLYVDLAPSYSSNSVDAVLKTANDGDVVSSKLVIAVYEAEGRVLESVKMATVSLQDENLVRLTNDEINGGTFARVFLWNGTTLAPLATVQGSGLTE